MYYFIKCKPIVMTEITKFEINRSDNDYIFRHDVFCVLLRLMPKYVLVGDVDSVNSLFNIAEQIDVYKTNSKIMMKAYVLFLYLLDFCVDEKMNEMFECLIERLKLNVYKIDMTKLFDVQFDLTQFDETSSDKNKIYIDVDSFMDEKLFDFLQRRHIEKNINLFGVINNMYMHDSKNMLVTLIDVLGGKTECAQKIKHLYGELTENESSDSDDSDTLRDDKAEMINYIENM